MSSSSWWYGSCATEHRFFGGKPFSATSLSYPVKRKLSIGLVLEFSSINGEMSRPFEYSFTKLGKRTFEQKHSNFQWKSEGAFGSLKKQTEGLPTITLGWLHNNSGPLQ